MSRWVKSINPDGSCTYFKSLEECCRVFGIRYHETLVRMIEKGQLADDGRTFFDYPLDKEVEWLERKYGTNKDHNQYNPKQIKSCDLDESQEEE